MKTATENKQLNRLKRLCETVNRRYASGLNDDDQVKSMFEYEKKAKNKARVVIGFDTYKALSTSELKELKKDAEILEDRNGVKYFEFNLTNNGIFLGRYKCILPI